MGDGWGGISEEVSKEKDVREKGERSKIETMVEKIKREEERD